MTEVVVLENSYNIVMVRSKCKKPPCPCCNTLLDLTVYKKDKFKMVWECEKCFGLFDHKTFAYVEGATITKGNLRYAYK